MLQFLLMVIDSDYSIEVLLMQLYCMVLIYVSPKDMMAHCA